MSEEKKMTEQTKITEDTKLFEEKKVADPFIAGFFESMAKTNTEKITREILADLSEDSDNSDEYDAESGDEDSEDRPWQPSPTVGTLKLGYPLLLYKDAVPTRLSLSRVVNVLSVGPSHDSPQPQATTLGPQ
jgi:hypothetical protein